MNCIPCTVDESTFLVTPHEGRVSAMLMRPANPSNLLVIGHGASTNMRHATLQTIAERMAAVGLATFRYNFPYAEYGRGRNSQQICTATVRCAVEAARAIAPDLPLLAGGYSFGGRMTSTAAAQHPLEGVRGLVFFSFPLHQPGKPDIKRAAHLDSVNLPMLFLSGTRDQLAQVDLLQPVCTALGSDATLHLLDTADHGFRILKRTRKGEENVFDEMALITRKWAFTLQAS